jgi:hypothetical protein
MKSYNLKFNLIGVSLVAFVLFLYAQLGRNYLNFLNFVIFMLTSVILLVASTKKIANFFSFLIIISLIPIIPAPLGGLPIGAALIFTGVFLAPKNDSLVFIKKFTYVKFLLALLFCILNFTAIFYNNNILFYLAWIYGILFIYLSITKIPLLLNQNILIYLFWIGTSITMLLSSFLYIFPKIKLPGIMSSVLYPYISDKITYSRYSGILGDYELYAQYAGISIFCSLYIYSVAKTKLTYFFSIVTLTFSLIQIILSGTRSAVFLTLFLMPILLRKLINQATKEKFFYLIPTMVFAMIFFIFKATSDKSGIESRSSNFFTNLYDTLWQSRLSLWQGFIHQIPENLFKIPRYLSFPINIYGSLPHSLYLSLLFMFGIIPAILIITLMFLPIFHLKSSDSLQFTYMIMLLFVMLDNSKVEVIRSPQSIVFIFTLIGICYSSITTTQSLRKIPK